jgi:hypothetical protein
MGSFVRRTIISGTPSTHTQRNRIITLKGKKVHSSADAFKEEPTFASTLQVQAPSRNKSVGLMI